jgi:hypothetical protein
MSSYREKRSYLKKYKDLRELIFMALCCLLGLFTKQLISPVTNAVTDLIRMPGGGMAGGLSMAFLLLGATFSSRRWAGTFMGFLQGLLALAFGMSGYQGIYAIFTYTVPGIAIDAMRLLWRGEYWQNGFFLLTCCLANASTAVASNLLVFHFHGLIFLLWVTLAACAGFFGGAMAGLIYKRLRFITSKEESKSP